MVSLPLRQTGVVAVTAVLTWITSFFLGGVTSDVILQLYWLHTDDLVPVAARGRRWRAGGIIRAPGAPPSHGGWEEQEVYPGEGEDGASSSAEAAASTTSSLLEEEDAENEDLPPSFYLSSRLRLR